MSNRAPDNQRDRKDLPPVRPQPDEAPAQRGGAGTVAPVRTQDGRGADCDERIIQLTRERDEALAVLGRVVANESNHYDRYWTVPDGPLTDQFLDATEAKMREALGDVFCDDAASVMLMLIAEIRRLRG